MDRRHFLSQLGGAAAAPALLCAAASKSAESQAGETGTLPTIPIGKYRLTRLVVGSNPINGYSYLGRHVDQHMREYFTVDRTVEFLLACEKAGINAHQFSTAGLDKAEQIFRKVREHGSKLHIVCLASQREKIKETVERVQPIAMAHHGGVTDRLFSQDKSSQVRDFVKASHDAGVLAGVSSHNPDCIQRMADEAWEVDFFMTCFYFISRKTFLKPGEEPRQPETLDLEYPFYRNDPAVMTRVVRQVKQPCLAFKILAAGRMCADQAAVRGAFRYAFENIKPSDGVIVGMYPRFFDEIKANAGYAREFAKGA